jgi:hypothetical protein
MLRLIVIMFVALIYGKNVFSQFYMRDLNEYIFNSPRQELTSTYSDTPVIFRYYYMQNENKKFGETSDFIGFYGRTGLDTSFTMSFSCNPTKNYVEGTIWVHADNYSAKNEIVSPSYWGCYYFKGYCAIKNGIFYYDAPLSLSNGCLNASFIRESGRLRMIADSSHGYLKGEIIFKENLKVAFHLTGVYVKKRFTKSFFEYREYFKNIQFIDLHSKPLK